MTEDNPSERPLDKGDGAASNSIRTGSTSSTRSRRTLSPSVASKSSEAPPTPESPPYRLTRKRTAAQLEKQEQEDDSEDITPTHSRVASGDSRDGLSTVCICQPDPKIPRPRNVFILYRQHHQAAIVAQNPGLANPEISKIIGEQWRSQPADIKNEWKVLAEEEKIRHQQQYPEYRYQPRRNGRRASTSEALLPSSAVDKPRCMKCGGRTIITPTTSTPITGREALPVLPPPSPSSSLTPTSRYLPMMNNLSLASPAHRRTRPGTGHPPAPLQLVSLRNHPDDGDLDVLSPDTKRRRFNNGPYAQIPGRPALGTPYPFPPPPQYQQRRESFPRPDALLARSSPLASGMVMGPPPRPMHPPHHDPSLVLPPLQNRNEQSRNEDPILMRFPFLGKIRVLGRITPPVRLPPASPNTRGAVIAVEGADAGAVQKLTIWLEDFFNKEGDYEVRVVEGPKVPESGQESSLLDFMIVATEWHKKNKELLEFITASPSPQATVDSSPSTEESHGNTSAATESPKRRTPLLLLPLYTLQATDAYASAIPIQDVYSPVDHWQWTATLWRGMVGPDFTVYVRDGNGNGQGQEEKTVEVREDLRTVIVKSNVVAAATTAGGGAGEVEGASLRRLGFEVGEWVRGVCGAAAERRKS